MRVLQSLTNQVKVTVFFDARARNAELHGLITRGSRNTTTPTRRIVFKTVDPTRHPADAELVLAAHKLTALKDRNFVIFDCDGRTQIIYQNELADYQLEPVADGQGREFHR